MPIPSNFPTSYRPARLLLDGIPRDNGNHVGNRILPDVSVDAENVGYYTVVEQKLNPDAIRASGAKFKETTPLYGASGIISVREYGQKSTIDARVQEDHTKNNDDLIAKEGRRHRKNVEDIKELQIANLVTTPANYAASNKETGKNLAATGIRSWMRGVKAAVKAGGYRVTSMGIGEDAMLAFGNNPDLHEWYGSANGVKNIGETMLSQFFQIPEVFVWGYSRVFDGQATPTEFWPANALLVFSKQASPDLDDSSLGFTAVTPYGAAFGRSGVLTDVRTSGPDGVEMLTEVAACQRWHEVLANPTLGFLSTAVTGF